MLTVEPYRAAHLPQLQQLVAGHLGALVPGWALPARFIAARLARNPDQPTIDPWVAERRTLCALQDQRLIAAAHLLRYRADTAVGAGYRNAADIAWLLGAAEDDAAREQLLDTAHAQIDVWPAGPRVAFDAGLPVPVCVGVSDAWPHIAATLRQAGYRPDPTRGEAVYGGALPPLPERQPPSPEITVQRSAGRFGTRFAARAAAHEVGRCEAVADLTHGGAVPALRGWAEFTELEVAGAWRNQGIGGWLVTQAVAWLRLAGCERVVLSVTEQDEAAGAGRFYQRFGWQPLARQQQGWQRSSANGAASGS